MDERFPHPLNMTCAIAWGFQSWPDHKDDPRLDTQYEARECRRRAGLRVNLKAQVAGELRAYGLTIVGNTEQIGHSVYVIRSIPHGNNPSRTITRPDFFPRTCQKAIDIIRGKEHTP